MRYTSFGQGISEIKNVILTCNIALFLSLILVVNSKAETPRTGPSVDTSHGYLKVSPDGRFFTHRDGTPFFYVGCTAWELFNRLTREEAERYLENRRQKGFTVIQAVAIGEIECGGANAYGEVPFGNNFAWNDKYYKHVDYIIDLAASKGLYIGILPIWAGCTWWFDKNSDKFKNYGEFLGARYASRSNVFWILGGDRNPPDGGSVQAWTAMADGIASKSGGHDRLLMTFHPRTGNSTRNFFDNSSWTDFNMLQTGHCRDVDVYNRIATLYNSTPRRPVLDGEPTYELHPICHDESKGIADDLDVRKFAYWEVFAGACGHTYGNNAIWQFYAPGRTPRDGPQRYWYDALDMDGAWDMMHLRNLMESRPYLTRVPDQSLVANALTGGDHIQATRGSDYLFVYTPQGKGFTLSMGKISGSRVKGYWFDPREGTSTTIGEFENTGTHQFSPPSSKDWVLVLDDASKNVPLPGSSSLLAAHIDNGKKR